jgi:hypothetical protein
MAIVPNLALTDPSVDSDTVEYSIAVPDGHNSNFHQDGVTPVETGTPVATDDRGSPDTGIIFWDGAPTFINGPIADFALVVNVLMTPIDYSGYFTVTGSESLTFTATPLPTGVVLSTAGIMSGTPTVIAAVSPVITATDTTLDTAVSNAFEIDVTA